MPPARPPHTPNHTDRPAGHWCASMHGRFPRPPAGRVIIAINQKVTVVNPAMEDGALGCVFQWGYLLPPALWKEQPVGAADAQFP